MSTITPPQKRGYTFEGYYSNVTGGVQYYKADGRPAKDKMDDIDNKGLGPYSGPVYPSRTLYAHYTPTSYEITYILHGGRFKYVISHKKEVTAKSQKGKNRYVGRYNIEDDDIELEDPERKGMVFNGWMKK